ncbi:netrin-1 [Galendromus occidentalis]|uniref:Netrin-1 n=1 Tax=Galendromus occidentalis TaxID=34638 RepID=A0AAJ7SIK6_9ACAR|nr:netrin-1 [Galendromus occidentalis]
MFPCLRYSIIVLLVADAALAARKKHRQLESDEDDGNTSSWLSMFQAEQAVIDPCQDERGTARRCIPDFENAAFRRRVHASSTCGKVATRHCQVNAVRDSVGLAGTTNEELVRTCQMCDASNPSTSHPAALLTDVNNPSNLTCWMSEAFNVNTPQNVSLRLSLGKKFELTYVSLQFCGSKPDSLAIFKSSDHGKSWQPFQYYSTNCEKTYGKSSRQKLSVHNEHEALCSDPNADKNGNSNNRIAFSTLDGRPSAYEFDKSSLLQDWVTATDIKIEFRRLLDPRQSESLSSENSIDDNDEDNSWTNETLNSAPVASTQEIKQAYNFYSVADLAVGGRCKCNGHASACVPSSSSTAETPDLECQCRHNTAGRDCEKCKPFYFDRPWARATSQNANECQPCQCNGHSRSCRFNMELYKLSGSRSGGVCIKCRHNTAGRHCHHCREGYYRNPEVALNNKRACKQCECHPIGSLGRICNMTTGQCPCKDGVTGLSCNRCQKGYQQSQSPIAPCVRIPQSEEPPIADGPADEDFEYDTDEVSSEDNEGACAECSRDINFEMICKKAFAIRAKILSQESFGQWARFTIEIRRILKNGPERLHKGLRHLWVPTENLKCRCPHLEISSTYVIVGSMQMHGGQLQPTFDPDGIIVQTSESLEKRIRKMVRKRSRCPE